MTHEQATPRPWYWDEGGGGLRGPGGQDVLEAYDPYVGIEISDADKALILDAVHNHDRLLATEKAARKVKSAWQWYGDSGHFAPVVAAMEALQRALEVRDE